MSELRTPSGKKASGHGQILIEVWPIGDWESAEVHIKSPENLPFGFWMVACEHMIRATAQRSNAGYDKAVGLLIEAAILKNKGGFLKNTEE